jgi:hypothetical protein
MILCRYLPTFIENFLMMPPTGVILFCCCLLTLSTHVNSKRFDHSVSFSRSRIKFDDDSSQRSCSLILYILAYVTLSEGNLVQHNERRNNI